MDERRRSRGGGEIDGEARKRKRVAGSWAGVGPAEIDVVMSMGRGSARVVVPLFGLWRGKGQDPRVW
jgi:hypothetical protein